MRVTVIAVRLIALYLVAAAEICAAELTPGQILERVSQVYSNLQRYQIEAVQGFTFIVSGAAAYQETKLALAVVKPGKVRLTRKDAQRELVVVSNGETTWTYLPGRKEYTQEAVAAYAAPGEMGAGEEEDGGLLAEPQNVLVGRYLMVSELGSAATLVKKDRVKFAGDNVDCYVVRVQVEAQTHDMWIDRARFLVLRHKTTTRLARRGGLTATVQSLLNLKSVDLTGTLDESLFLFTPPAKAKRVQALGLPGERVDLRGKVAADFTLKSLDGDSVHLSDLRGKIVLIGFWATWCPPCRKELPVLEKLQEEHQDAGLVVLAITDEDAGTVKSFFKKNPCRLFTLMDSKRAVHKLYGTRAIPALVIINRQGVVVAQYVGGRSREELAAALETAKR